MPDAKPASSYMLARVVPRLECLVDLSICGLDLRPDPWRREESQRDGGTDALFLALAKLPPRLSKLRLVASPDLTEGALCTFLESDGASALVDLEIGSCPGLGAESVRSIASFCPRLRSLSLKALNLCDSVEQPNNVAAAANGHGQMNTDLPHPLSLIAQKLKSLVSISLSNLCCPLPPDVFNGFRPAEKLANVSLASLPHLDQHHLLCFFAACTITHLRVWHCPKLATFPVVGLSSKNLRSVSLFGCGLTVGGLWELGRSGLVRLFIDAPVRDLHLDRTQKKEPVPRFVPPSPQILTTGLLRLTEPRSEPLLADLPYRLRPLHNIDILSPHLESDTIVEALEEAHALETLVLYGWAGEGKRLSARDVQALKRMHKSLVVVAV
jgi:hypothetical protein